MLTEPLVSQMERESAKAAAEAEGRVTSLNRAAEPQPAVPSSKLEDLVVLEGTGRGSAIVEEGQISYLRELPKAYLDEHPGLLSKDDPIKGVRTPPRTRDEVLAYLERAATDERASTFELGAIGRYLDKESVGRLRSTSKFLKGDDSLLRNQEMHQREEAFNRGDWRVQEHDARENRLKRYSNCCCMAGVVQCGAGVASCSLLSGPPTIGAFPLSAVVGGALMAGSLCSSEMAIRVGNSARNSPAPSAPVRQRIRGQGD